MDKLKFPHMCAWCGSAEVVGTYPVVIDKTRVSWDSLSSLQYEDQLHTYNFPICATCKGQIRTRRNLNKRAVEVMVAVGILLSIVLAVVYKNIGFSIFLGFCISAVLFALFLLLKRTILRIRGYASETSWGKFEEGKFIFRVEEFEGQFSEMNPQIIKPSS